MHKLINSYISKMNYPTKSLDLVGLVNSHPNFPSLLSITDSLTQVGIENIVAKIPFHHFDELPNLFIVELCDKNEGLYILEKKGGDIFLIDENGKTNLISISDLEKCWTNFVFVIEENTKQENKKELKHLIPIVLLLICTFFIVKNNFSNLYSIFLIISGIGIFFSFEILKTYFKENDETETRFCSLKENFSCDSIIKSKSYHFSNWIEFVDLPIIFFSFTFFGLLFSIISVDSIGILSIFSIPILIYSIYFQKFIIKKWCLLCLSISFLLIINSTLYIFNIDLLNYNLTFFTNEVLLFFLITSIWLYLKKNISEKIKYKDEINFLLRFKRNEEVFQKVTNNVKDFNLFNKLEKIIIGNKSSKNVLTLFLSPNCPHCHVAYFEAVELVRKNPDNIRLEIAYNLNMNNFENPYLIVARIIMQIQNLKKDKVIDALNDWHIKKMEIEKWKNKWQINDNFLKENEQLEKHFQWCAENELNYSPVRIFNKKILNQYYEVNEMMFFIEEGEEENQDIVATIA